jgi:hypothetical protein
MKNTEVKLPIIWAEGIPRFEGREAVNELRRQIHLPDDKKPILLIHSRNDKAPLSFEGHRVCHSAWEMPDSPEEQFVFTIADNGRPILQKLVWPIEKGDLSKHLFPLMGVQIIQE